MNEEQHRLFVKELRLEIASLKGAIQQVKFKNLSSENTRLQKELSENNKVSEEEIRQRIKEALIPENKELPISKKPPIFYSQPDQENIPEVIDLNTLLKRASMLAILREKLKK